MEAAPSTASAPNSAKSIEDGLISHSTAYDFKDEISFVASDKPTPASMKQSHICPVHPPCLRRHQINPNTDSLTSHEEVRGMLPAGSSDMECTCGTALWTHQKFDRVARMFPDKPFSNHKYEYLSILNRCPAPVRVCDCASCQNKVPTSSRPSRVLRSMWHTLKCAVGPNSNFRKHQITFDVGNHKHTGTITYGLDTRDFECPVLGRHDWTTDWTWALAVRQRDEPRGWSVDGRFYFNRLPLRLQQGVPWRDSSATEEREARGPERIYSDTSRPPRWCAAIKVEHSIAGVQYPYFGDTWYHFEPQTAEKAQLLLRTGPGRFKRVMWYHVGVGYGNDIEGHRPGPCDEKAMNAFASFVQPLIYS